ncbi:hypothetical protein OEZ86_002453 [Tetradesmus obliquus]|nr:hypothetical protein OEZ86_002453 [Tetradesmus obliquus]
MYTADRTRCNDVKPNRAPQQAVVSGYPDPWSVSLSWKAPGGACVDFYYVFVRPSTKQRPGDRDAKPYQILTTDQSSIVVYNLKSSTPYRVDIVAVNKRKGRSPYASVTPSTPRDARFDVKPSAPAKPAAAPAAAAAARPKQPAKTPAPAPARATPAAAAAAPRPARRAGPVLWPGFMPVGTAAAAPAAAAPAVCDPSRPLQAPAGVTAVFPAGARDRAQIRWQAPPLSSCSLQGYRLTAVDASGTTVLNTQLAVSERDITVNNLGFYTSYTFALSALSPAGDGAAASVAVNPSTGGISVTGASSAPAARAAEVTRVAGAAADSAAQQQMPPPGPMDSNGVQNMQNGASCRADVEPAAPQGFVATPDGTGRITLSWGNKDASICTDSFKIDGYVLKTGDPVISTQTGSTSYTLTQLQPGVEYAFTIAAVNSKGNSTPATAMASTTKSRR